MKGKQLSASRKSVNQFYIGKPKKVKKISYVIAETWDTQMDSLPIYPMAGSSFVKDHALISPHTVIGFIPRLQQQKYSLKINHSTCNKWYDERRRTFGAPFFVGFFDNSCDDVFNFNLNYNCNFNQSKTSTVLKPETFCF